MRCAAASEMKLCVEPESRSAMRDVSPSWTRSCIVSLNQTPVMAWSEKWGDASVVAFSSDDSGTSSVSFIALSNRNSCLQTWLCLRLNFSSQL